MFTKTFSATHSGIDGVVIQIEAALQRAVPKIHITGLAGDVVKESQERVRACLLNQGFDIPTGRMLVHLSPAQAKKQGSQFDLAIALSVLHAEGMLGAADLSRTAFLGELSLDGKLHRISGAIALIEALENFSGVDTVILPKANQWEAGVLSSKKVKLAKSIGDALEFIRRETDLPRVSCIAVPTTGPTIGPTIDEVVGQKLAKRALEISLAGRHHLLLLGPPGVGKSLLASTAARLLPPLERDEWVELVKGQGTGGFSDLSPASGASRTNFRPFRTPHHSASAAALLGGGSGSIIPGEVSLAHTGVLFLDEFPEFRRDLIEGLREPLQSGMIHLHRIGRSVSLPARFTLIAAMNPCPCGYSIGNVKRCHCTRDKVLAYRKRISGPIFDRLDLSVVMGMPASPPLPATESSHARMAARIGEARSRQRDRYRELLGVRQNAEAPIDGPAFLLAAEEQKHVGELAERETLSFRAIHKWLRVARTIADLDGQAQIGRPHLQEAWGVAVPGIGRPLAALVDEVLALLFAPTCAVCERNVTSGGLCADCAKFIDVEPPWCAVCGYPTPEPVRRCGECRKHPRILSSLTRVRSAYWLDERAKTFLHRIKYSGRFELLSQFRPLVEGLDFGSELSGYEIIPVPLYPKRWLGRGFNQSEILGRWVANSKRAPLSIGELRRSRDTPSQTGFTKTQRAKNMKASFAWRASRRAPERALLVDDVCTTGATLDACARALRRAGTREIFAWSLFRTHRQREVIRQLPE